MRNSGSGVVTNSTKTPTSSLLKITASRIARPPAPSSAFFLFLFFFLLVEKTNEPPLRSRNLASRAATGPFVPSPRSFEDALGGQWPRGGRAVALSAGDEVAAVGGFLSRPSIEKAP